MKMLKKVTAVVAVLLLVFGTMSIGVTAAGETGSIGITITADDQDGSRKYYPGDIVTFTVNISTSFNYTAMRWPVMYTLKAFEPVIGNDGNGEYAIVKAIADGSETTVKMSMTAYNAAKGNQIVITDKLVTDQNGYIVSLTPAAAPELLTFGGFEKDDELGVYTGAYQDGVISFDNGQSFAVAANMPVYAYNQTTRCFEITTVGAYIPAGSMECAQMVMDGNHAVALYIVENNNPWS